jgi:hypothetical protein
MSQIDKFNEREAKTRALKTKQSNSLMNNSSKDADKKTGEVLKDFDDLGKLKEKMEAKMTEETTDITDDKKIEAIKENKSFMASEYARDIDFSNASDVEAAYEKFQKEGGDEQSESNEKKTEENDSNILQSDQTDQSKSNGNILYVGQEDSEEQNENDDWVEEYNAFLTKWASENGDKWNRDLGDPEKGIGKPEGLRGKLKNSGATYHYTRSDKVSVSITKGEQPEPEHFKGLLALAKEKGQVIGLDPAMDETFRRALIIACARDGHKIESTSMSPEDQAFYDENNPNHQDEVTVNKDENSDSKEGNPKSHLNILRARITLKNFDRAFTYPGLKEEMDTTMARYEALPDVSIGGDNKESEIYTIAAYAKTFREHHASPDNQELSEKVAKFEKVLGKYGIEITKETAQDGQVRLGTAECKDKYHLEEVNKNIAELSKDSYTNMSNKSKYNTIAKSGLKGEQLEKAQKDRDAIMLSALKSKQYRQ